MKEYARSFYSSKRWQQTRKAYAASVGGLCERCYQKGRIVPGAIVHHKIHLNPVNIKDPLVALNWQNLELLCRDCHAVEHADDQLEGIQARTQAQSKRRYRVDDLGRVIGMS